MRHKQPHPIERVRLLSGKGQRHLFPDRVGHIPVTHPVTVLYQTSPHVGTGPRATAVVSSDGNQPERVASDNAIKSDTPFLAMPLRMIGEQVSSRPPEPSGVKRMSGGGPDGVGGRSLGKGGKPAAATNPSPRGDEQVVVVSRGR
jgi:hypothetical protein